MDAGEEKVPEREPRLAELLRRREVVDDRAHPHHFHYRIGECRLKLDCGLIHELNVGLPRSVCERSQQAAVTRRIRHAAAGAAAAGCLASAVTRDALVSGGRSRPATLATLASLWPQETSK